VAPGTPGPMDSGAGGGHPAGMGAGIAIRRIGPGEVALLAQAAEDVFDNPVDPVQAAAFLGDPSARLLAALAPLPSGGAQVVGIASATIFRHPDKAPQLWINEVAVSPGWRRRGIARRLVADMLDEGRAAGCVAAWLAAEGDNLPARALYRRLGAAEREQVVVYDWRLTSPPPDA